MTLQLCIYFHLYEQQVAIVPVYWMCVRDRISLVSQDNASVCVAGGWSGFASGEPVPCL